MAKKKNKSITDTIQKYFYFKNSVEFIIFVIWGLFVSVILTTFIK